MQRSHGEEYSPQLTSLAELPANRQYQLCPHLISEIIQELSLASVKSAYLMPCKQRLAAALSAAQVCEQINKMIAVLRH